ncbi:ferredoxin [Mycobacterium sp. QGD 101]|uniref:ferredoxin n=1 Tax=Mycobacterium hubeiense TaxID=1867256 RepID=UPI000C7EADFE
MAYVIAEPCVDVMDKACVEECPVDCIYEGPRKMYIHPDECIDCRACEPVCPMDAIYYVEDLPAQWAPYAHANADFFAGLGSPGGASSIGKREMDAAFIAAQPKRAVTAPPKNEPPPVLVSLGRMARKWLK